jgi:hypothetical protein
MKRIVVILFNIPWDWSTDYTKQTAFVLAKENIVVCYMWSESFTLKEYFQKAKFPILIKKHSNNIYLYYPILFIPFRRFKIIVDINQKINIYLLKIFVKFFEITNRISKKRLWVFDPELYPLTKEFGKDYFPLYDCVDFFAVGNKKSVQITERNEKALCNAADVVVANSLVLQKHLKEYRKDIGLVPQGFRVERFEINKNKYISLHAKHPVIGFVGGINNRLDTSLLLSLIQNNPKWTFILWGPVQKEILTGSERMNKIQKILDLPNVVGGKSRDKEEIPGIISQFDIGIIPYDISQDFNKYCYPMKLFEYFYMEKPVISTPIEELKRFPKFVMIGNNTEEWEDIIKKILSKKWPEKYKKEQKNLAVQNNWENKIKTIVRYI